MNRTGKPIPPELLRAMVSHGDIGNLEVLASIERPGSLLWRARTLDRKPRRELVVKLTRFLRAEDVGEGAPPDRIRREYEALRQLRQVLSPWKELSVPEPIACFPEHSALIMEAVEGQTLKQLILRSARRLAVPAGWKRVDESLRLAGRWLAKVQALIRDPRERLDLDGLLAYNEWRLRRLLDLGLMDSALAGSVRREADRLCRLVPPGEEQAVVFAHGDFCPANMMVGERSLVVLDFTMVERGFAHQDLTYCYEHLERLLNRFADRPFMRRATIRSLQENLLEGYVSEASLSPPLFRLGQLRHHLNYIVNLQEPEAGLRRLLRRIETRRTLRGLRSWIEGRVPSPAANCA